MEGELVVLGGLEGFEGLGDGLGKLGELEEFVCGCDEGFVEGWVILGNEVEGGREDLELGVIGEGG